MPNGTVAALGRYQNRIDSTSLASAGHCANRLQSGSIAANLSGLEANGQRRHRQPGKAMASVDTASVEFPTNADHPIKAPPGHWMNLRRMAQGCSRRIIDGCDGPEWLESRPRRRVQL